MKKTLFAILATCSLLFAESYQINTLSAKQLGMGHTGAGQKLGSESMHFNPGALGFLDRTLDISGGVTFIMPTVEFQGLQGKAENTKMGTPLYVYVASSVTDWFSAGISFTTPYGNSADYGKDWEGSALLQDISLAVYAFQPTVAFKVRDDISIGVGPAIYFGSFEQSKALIPAGKFNGLKEVAPFLAANPPLRQQLIDVTDKYADVNAASATFSGDADVAVGANLGVLYDLIPNKLSLGVAYRSEAKMKVSKGKVKMSQTITDAELKTLNTVIGGVNPYLSAMGRDPISPIAIPDLEQENFVAELPLPANLNTGISFRPIPKLLLAFDWQMVFWNAYDELTLEFDNLGKQVSQKNYHITDAYRFGLQYTVINQLDLRLGMYYDETPVDDDYLTPESPSTNKLGTTVGFSFRPVPNFSIDASFLYSKGSGKLGRESTSENNPEKGEADGLNGRYSVTALVPSVGISFIF